MACNNLPSTTIKPLSSFLMNQFQWTADKLIPFYFYSHLHDFMLPGKNGERQLWKAGSERLESIFAECHGLYQFISFTELKGSFVLEYVLCLIVSDCLLIKSVKLRSFKNNTGSKGESRDFLLCWEYRCYEGSDPRRRE